MVAGEEAHDIGERGLRRAKLWLEVSTRVGKSWTRHDRPMAELLEFKWPHLPPDSQSASFSFDLGGTFRGGDLDNKSFLAEVKAYKNESDLPAHFKNFLAKCYVALEQRPSRCDYLLWISWAPFQAKAWDRHTTTDNIKKSIAHRDNRNRVLGVDAEDEAAARMTPDTLVAVADRVWLITLCRQQEQLVLLPNHYLEVVKLITAEGGIGT